MMALSTGKQIRGARFKYPQRSAGLIVPIDHGLTIGPVAGIRDTREIAGWISHPAICGVIAHKGILERLAARGALAGKGVILHLNGMSTLATEPDRKEIIASVETAVGLGADGVSIQLNFNGDTDSHNLQLLGRISEETQRLGLPLLTMLYDKLPFIDEDARLWRLRHLIRICVELGTDAIKLAPPKSAHDLPAILEDTREDAAVYFAGGELMPDEELFALTRDAVRQGAAGLCVGRNVFQRKDPGPVLSHLQTILSGSEESNALIL